MQIVLVADVLQLQPVKRAFAFQAGVWQYTAFFASVLVRAR
jgi:hypothetical protein